MPNVNCPMCGAKVSVAANAKEGNLVYCDACDAELEVVSVKPLEVDWPLDDYDEDASYDDYDDDDYGDDDEYEEDEDD